MAFRRSGHLAARHLLPGLGLEVEHKVSKQPERILRRAGIQFLGQVCLPSTLQKAIRSALQGHSSRQIRRDVAQLSETMRAATRGWPADKGSEGKEEGDDEFAPRESSRGEAALLIAETINDVMVEKAIKPGAKRALSAAKGTAFEYTERAAAAYMAARMPSSYAAVLRVLSELKTRLPGFEPSSLLDFGTGPGTSIWAVHGTWPASLQRLIGIEAAPPMANLCSLLLQDLPEVPRLQAFSSLETASRKLRGEERLFDLVIAAYTLGELPEEEREATVRRLWSHTRDLLVLVEPGNPRGWQTVAKAREHVLGTERKRARKKRPATASEESDAALPAGAHVVAPCAHDGKCPMEGTVSWCHFPQRVQRSEVQRLAKKAQGATIRYNHEDEKFSFVVLRRGPRPQVPSPLQQLPAMQARTKDARALKEEAFKKQAIYMQHLQKALQWKPRQEVEGEKTELHAWAEGLQRLVDEKAQQGAEGLGNEEARRSSTEEAVDSVQALDGAGDRLAKGGERLRVGERRNQEQEDRGVDSETGELGEEEDEEDEEDEEYGEREEEDEELGEREEDEEDEEQMAADINPSWARIVRAPRRRGSHAILDICCSSNAEGTKGELQRHILTKNTPKLEYRFARKSHWGDLWPM